LFADITTSSGAVTCRVSSRLMPQDIEWTEAERFPYHAGTWRTPQAVVEQLLLPLRRDWSSFSTTPIDYLADSERVWWSRYCSRHSATLRRSLSYVVEGGRGEEPQC
jgi:hypothetical protein